MAGQDGGMKPRLTQAQIDAKLYILAWKRSRAEQLQSSAAPHRKPKTKNKK